MIKYDIDKIPRCNTVSFMSNGYLQVNEVYKNTEYEILISPKQHIVTVVDVNIDSNTDTLVFGLSEEKYKTIDINLSGNNIFPNITTLVIEENVRDILITNAMFPNVKTVVSKNKNYENSDMLIYNEATLLNSFIKDEDYILDMSDIELIKSNALHGCKAKKIINTNSIAEYSPSAFNGYELYTDPKTKAKLFNNILVEINQESEEIEFPDESHNLVILDDDLLDFQCKRLRIHRYSTFSAMIGHGYPPETIIIDIPEGYDEDLDMFDFFENISSCVYSGFYFAHLQINNSKVLKTIDDIIYSIDMKNLLLCLRTKTGVANIPEGVEIISQKAFSKSKISEVVLPDSLKSIENLAFAFSQLKNIKFGKNISFIGSGAFKECYNLTEIDIPGSVSVITSECFSNTPIEKLTLNEGVKFIDRNVFNSKIEEVHLPASIEQIEAHNFTFSKRIYTIDKIPSGLLSSVYLSTYFNSFVVDIYCNNELLCVPKFSYNYEKMNFIELLKSNRQTSLLKTFTSLDTFNFKKLNVVMYIYEKTKNSFAKNVLDEYAESYIKDAIRNWNDENEDTLIKLIKFCDLKYDVLKVVLDFAEKSKKTSLAAYSLNKLKQFKSFQNDEFNI